MKQQKRIGEGFKKGIRLGPSSCNNAAFSIMLPLYMEKHVTKIPNYPSYEKLAFRSEIFDDIKSICHQERDKFMYGESDSKMFRINLQESWYSTDNLNQMKRYTKECILLSIHWYNVDNRIISHGTVYKMLSIIRDRISKYFQTYKPKDYKPGKRKISSVWSIERPIILDDKLPF